MYHIDLSLDFQQEKIEFVFNFFFFFFFQVDKYGSEWEKKFSVVIHQNSFSDYEIFYSTLER